VSEAAERPASSIPARLWQLSWPVIGLNVLNVLALAVDTAMCGRLPHAEAALTGLGFASQLVFLLMVSMLGLLVGAAALISRAHGAEDTARVDHIFAQAGQLTVALGVAIAVFGNLLAEPALWVLGARGEALREGLMYLRPLLAGTALYYLSLFFAGILRAVGDTRLPFLVALVANLVNVALNYCLILGNLGFPSLGVLGAAIGTLASQAISVLLLTALLRRGAVPALRLRLRLAPLDVDLARELWRVGYPAAADLVILNAGFLSIIGMLGRIDQVAVAAHGIGLRVQALAFVPGLSVSQAVGAMVGNALGAEDVAEARAVTRAGVALCTLIMTSLAVPIVLGAAPIVGVFDVAAGTPLADYSVQWIRLLGYGMPIVGVHIAFTGMFRGSGATWTSLNINLVTTLAQIPLSYALGFWLELGAWGVWVAFPLSFGAKAVIDYVWYRRGGWARTGAEVE
jgi:putative MATE family efflux protein